MPVNVSPSPQSDLLPQGPWRVDPSRSRVEFTVRKLGAGTVRGHFADADGRLVVEAGEALASGSVRVASIATGNEDRDAHLRSFFAAEAYPEIVFTSREIVPVDQHRFRIRGELTIRDHRREVELTGTCDTAHRIEVRGEIDRRDFGLTWNRAIEATGAVSTTIRIELDLQLVGAPSLP
jgi:polyisoprenoid-binding protein YceI